jgi:NADPH-dependent curcumin reductase CurA
MGLLDIGAPKPGETVVVAAAMGPGRIGRRTDRQDQGLSRHRHRRRTQEVRVKSREDVVTGLENAPQAFLGMLAGRNIGKLVVKVSE